MVTLKWRWYKCLGIKRYNVHSKSTKLIYAHYYSCTLAIVMSLFNFAFGLRPQPGRKVTDDIFGDVEMGEPSKALESEVCQFRFMTQSVSSLAISLNLECRWNCSTSITGGAASSAICIPSFTAKPGDETTTTFISIPQSPQSNSLTYFLTASKSSNSHRFSQSITPATFPNSRRYTVFTPSVSPFASSDSYSESGIIYSIDSEWQSEWTSGCTKIFHLCSKTRLCWRRSVHVYEWEENSAARCDSEWSRNTGRGEVVFGLHGAVAILTENRHLFQNAG